MIPSISGMEREVKRYRKIEADLATVKSAETFIRQKKASTGQTPVNVLSLELLGCANFSVRVGGVNAADILGALLKTLKSRKRDLEEELDSFEVSDDIWYEPPKAETPWTKHYCPKCGMAKFLGCDCDVSTR